MRYAIPFALLILCTVLVSCEKKPTACIAMDEVFAAGQTIRFESCSKNYEFLTWQFGDGIGLESEAPTYEYREEGQYTITLTAYSDGAFKSDEVVESHYASFKYLDKFELTGTFGSSTVLQFYKGDSTYSLTVDAGTYTDANPIVADVYSTEHNRFRPFKTTYGVRQKQNGTTTTLVDGSANFTLFDQPYSEREKEGYRLRVYWRFKSPDEF